MHGHLDFSNGDNIAILAFPALACDRMVFGNLKLTEARDMVAKKMFFGIKVLKQNETNLSSAYK